MRLVPHRPRHWPIAPKLAACSGAAGHRPTHPLGAQTTMAALARDIEHHRAGLQLVGQAQQVASQPQLLQRPADVGAPEAQPTMPPRHLDQMPYGGRALHRPMLAWLAGGGEQRRVAARSDGVSPPWSMAVS